MGMKRTEGKLAAQLWEMGFGGVIGLRGWRGRIAVG